MQEAEEQDAEEQEVEELQEVEEQEVNRGAGSIEEVEELEVEKKAGRTEAASGRWVLAKSTSWKSDGCVDRRLLALIHRFCRKCVKGSWSENQAGRSWR